MNKGSIVERLCSDLIAKSRDINGLLYFTLLYLHRNAYVVIAYFHSSTIKQEIETFYISPCYAFAFNVM